MPYSSDIDALGNQHRWSFDGDLLDSVGSADGVNSGFVLTGTPVCKDVTNSVYSDGISDRVTIPNTADINNSAQTRKAIAGWFRITAIQNPPKRIYGEGNNIQSFSMLSGWGNNVIFEIDDGIMGVLQIFTDVPLVVNRNYHLCSIFEGNGYANEFRAYLDGIKQLSAEPTNRQPDVATLTARTPCEYGDPAGTVSIGGTAVILIANINGHYNQWASFDGANAVLTDVEIREELFEKGALSEITISSGTEAVMQTALDAYADTVRGNFPLCIQINAVTGDGNLSLDADNITFDKLASIHVRYEGTGTLTWTNSNGGDASLVSGDIVLINPTTLTLSNLLAGSEVRIYDDNGAGGSFGTELSGIESLAGTSYNYTHSGISNDIAIQIMKIGYVEIILRITLDSDNITITFQQVIDTNE